MPKTKSPGRILDPDQAAEFLGVPRRWLVREAVPKGKVPYLKPPGSRIIRFLESDLWRVLESWKESDRIGTPPKELRRRKARKRKVKS